jgi:PAS domain S-box-containing protein
MSNSDTDSPFSPLPNPAEFLELVRAVATSANAATTVEQAMQTCLDRVCALTQWPVGHLYLCSEPPHCELQSRPVWHVDDPVRFRRFQELTGFTTFSPGIGLPGRVLATGSPAWITDIASDPNFVRKQVANDLGIRAAFAFPILVGPEVVGVLEFFSLHAVEPQEQLLEVMADIGAILGRVVERKRADEALRESEMKFRCVAQSAVDAIISSDSKGLITSWNRGAELIFGYQEDEVLGGPLTMLMPERYRYAHKQGMERVNSTGETPVIGKIVELHGLRKDGSEFPLELSR